MIQRYSDIYRMTMLDDTGDYVLYTDHIAALTDEIEAGNSVLSQAMAEIERLNSDLEVATSDENKGLWRFWNAKARDLAAKLEAVKATVKPLRWMVSETLSGGTIRWQVVEHEHHARDLAKNYFNGGSVTPLYAALVSSPALEAKTDGARPLPFDRDTLGRFVREAWVRWAEKQDNPKPSWLAPYDELSEFDKEADRQIGEAVARWTLIGDAASQAVEADHKPAMTVYVHDALLEHEHHIDFRSLGVGKIDLFVAPALEANQQVIAEFMIRNSFVTGHGDTVEDLLSEFQVQLDERRQVAARTALATQNAGARESAIRKAGQVAIDHLIDTCLTFEASGDDLADYLTRIVDACVRAALISPTQDEVK